jgi:glutaredoxin 3
MNTSPSITIYGSETCAFCTAARMLLKKRGLDYDDVLVSGNPDSRREMIARSGSESVPQIFIGEQAIGGFDELCSLERSGDLDRLLGVETID